MKDQLVILSGELGITPSEAFSMMVNVHEAKGALITQTLMPLLDIYVGPELITGPWEGIQETYYNGFSLGIKLSKNPIQPRYRINVDEMNQYLETIREVVVDEFDNNNLRTSHTAPWQIYSQ